MISSFAKEDLTLSGARPGSAEPADRLDRDDAGIAGVIVGIRGEKPVIIDVIGVGAEVDERLRAAAERCDLDAEALIAAAQAAPDRAVTLDVAIHTAA